jgi:hypothetical protein
MKSLLSISHALFGDNYAVAFESPPANRSASENQHVTTAYNLVSIKPCYVGFRCGPYGTITLAVSAQPNRLPCRPASSVGPYQRLQLTIVYSEQTKFQ